MKRIPEEFIERIKEETDLPELISERVRLKRTGANYMGLCPFHNEKTPSFSVSATKGFYKCFGCGESGNAFTWLMKTKGLSFEESVRLLAERLGLEVPVDDVADDEDRKERETLENMNKAAARFYFNQLRSNPQARQYVTQRGIKDATMISFGLGLAPDSWDALFRHLKSQGFREADIKKSGLMSGIERGKCYDRFRNRLMFPVFDYRGRITGFGARVFDDSKPKYLNSPETQLFRKGTNLYGLNFFIKNRKKEDDTLLIVEGYMDCIALHQAGFVTAVAALGTALTQIQARLMKRWVQKVIVAFDADQAGQMATLRGLEVLEKEGFSIHILTIPDGKDPDEYLKSHGREAFSQLLASAQSLTEFRINMARDGLDLKKEDDKITYLKRLAPLFSPMSNIEKDVWVGKIATETGVSSQALSGMIQKGYDRKLWMTSKTAGPFLESGHRRAQRILLNLLAKGYREVADALGPEEWTGEAHKAIYKLLMEYEGDHPDAYLTAHLTQAQAQSEWVEIVGIEDFPEDVEVAQLIRDYVRTVQAYNLEARKKSMLSEIAALEEAGRMEESLQIARELLDIQKRLGGK
ncbi:DNA primase [Clostridiaceae bacterium JG1575]|nr:DNA primase [Clostridiaceae bacterium JG1575]